MQLSHYFGQTEDYRRGEDARQGVGFQDLREARQASDGLFALLGEGGLYLRGIPERHRLIFYLGHLEAFDWNLVVRWHLQHPGFRPEWDQLFAFGIDPPPGKLPDDPPSAWPPEDEVRKYCAMIRADLDALWPGIPTRLKHFVIEHRYMHFETLCYLLHELDYGCRSVVRKEIPVTRPPAEDWLEIPEGEAALGAGPDAPFGWDNEFQAHRVHVSGFLAAKHKVTNRQYLEFVRAGGPAPHFWVPCRDGYCYRGWTALQPMPESAPVYLTQVQAAAYASWRGVRLPSEAEWIRYAGGAGAVENDWQSPDPLPVDATPESASVWGVEQAIGNGWEWTADLFRPFPGFEQFPEYQGYSAPFFDEHHYVMKGASPATPPKLRRLSFRNWFRKDYPYTYATCRLVRDR